MRKLLELQESEPKKVSLQTKLGFQDMTFVYFPRGGRLTYINWFANTLKIKYSQTFYKCFKSFVNVCTAKLKRYSYLLCKMVSIFEHAISN